MTNQFQLRDDLLLLKHPFYQAWMEGRLTQQTLQDYVGQYYHHVEAFPRYLENAIAICDDQTSLAILKENLAEENGTVHGTPHPELWLQFANGMGVSDENVKAAKLRLGIQNVVGTFNRLSKSSFAEALGSLYAYESQVPEIAQSKIEGLKQHFGIHDAKTLAFFEVHRTADIDHRESLSQVINRFSPEQRAQAQAAADAACQALWDFLSDVLETSEFRASA